MFDLGVYAGGYASDITRTFAVGETDSRLRDIYSTVLAANEAGIAASVAGASFGSVDKAARDVIDAAGYGEYFMHRVGHGLGMDTHEYPSLHGLNTDIIQNGNVFTVEPGIYVPGLGGVRIEDDVLVTAEGPQTLTSFLKNGPCLTCNSAERRKFQVSARAYCTSRHTKAPVTRIFGGWGFMMGRLTPG